MQLLTTLLGELSLYICISTDLLIEKETDLTDVFERLRKGETIWPNDRQAYRMLKPSYNT